MKAPSSDNCFTVYVFGTSVKLLWRRPLFYLIAKLNECLIDCFHNTLSSSISNPISINEDNTCVDNSESVFEQAKRFCLISGHPSAIMKLPAWQHFGNTKSDSPSQRMQYDECG